jgi:hypothetical protein
VKKQISLVLLIISVFAMSSCTRTARLYPVQGPLSAQTPTPVFFAKITGLAYPLNISLVLSSGELCKGRWAQVAPTQLVKGANASVQITAGDMSSVWHSVYGPGYYVAHVLGTYYYYESVVSGNRGTVINMELYLDDRESQGSFKGVARDNKGNIYKLLL